VVPSARISEKLSILAAPGGVTSIDQFFPALAIASMEILIFWLLKMENI
jgi:hypothetical protein